MNKLAAVGMVMLWAVGAGARPQSSDFIPWPRKIAPEQLARLTEQMADPDAQTRVRAMEEAGRLRAKEAWRAIAERLGDQAVVQCQGQTVTVAAVACATLGMLQERQAVPLLIPLLDDPDMKNVACAVLPLLGKGFSPRRLQMADLLRLYKLPPDQALPQDLRDPLRGCDPANWEAWWTWQGLAGREVVVRVYKDPARDPVHYELVKAVVLGGRGTPGGIPLGAIPGADPCSIVVFCAQDQQVDDLRVMLGRWITVSSGSSKGLSVTARYVPLPGGHMGPSRWMIEDALGQPIPGAKVEIWLAPGNSRDSKPSIRLGQWTVPTGDLEVIQVNGGFCPRFVVSHPDYGKALVPAGLPREEHVRAQLVRLDSEAGSRAIWGTVVDESGSPVPDARMRCQGVRTLGEGLINPGPEAWRGEVVTDATGFFLLYMTPDNRREEARGRLIPPGSRYRVRVEPPPGSRLIPFEGEIKNGSPAQIVLDRGGKARTFVFETSDGILQDPDQLQEITIQVCRPNRTPLRYSYAQWSAGWPMPPGTYTAAMGPPSSRRQFEAMEVSADSPDVLVFHPRPGATYSGQIVDARTGRPLAGVFVLLETARGQKRLSDFTTEQWGGLERLNAHPARNEEALKPVRETYAFVDVVRTDEQGAYEIRLNGADFYGFIYFARNYIPVQCRKVGLTPDETGHVQVPLQRLYPAGRVSILVRTDIEGVRTMPQWHFDVEHVPAWARDLLWDRPGGPLSLDCHDPCPSNVRQLVFVPAEVPLQLAVGSPTEDRVCPFVFPQTICLAPGDVMDLGSCTLEETLTVAVQVVDREGKTREGVPVSRRMGNAFFPTHNTDENGLATFRVPPHSSGEFGVFPLTVLDHNPRRFTPEAVPFQIGDREDQGKQFTLTLSDELLTTLFADCPASQN
jgi:hypothetical protein